MKLIKSTGNPQEDAKLLAEDKRLQNNETFEEARERAAISNSGKESGNALVATPHTEGETIAVIREPEDSNLLKNGKKNEAMIEKKAASKPVNAGLNIQPATNEPNETSTAS